MPEPGKIFPERLRALRVHRGFTLSQLGEMVGLSKTSLSGFETGRNEPSFGALIKLAQALDASLDYLTGLGSAQSHCPPWLLPRLPLLSVMPDSGQAAINAIIDALAVKGPSLQEMLDMEETSGRPEGGRDEPARP
jgi:transcriptional regulator with XRE-family HTH domain